MTTAEFISRVESWTGRAATQKGADWMALCPGHDDHNPSLSIKEGDGKIILHCFAGCDLERIITPLNLKPKDLFADTSPRQQAPCPPDKSPVVARPKPSRRPELGEAPGQSGPAMKGNPSTITCYRTEDGLELIALNPNAFVLLYVIAHRAQWDGRFNKRKLAPGESFLGDYREYGMTERGYRTAKQQLEKHGFATFKATNKGTIATITSTNIFDIWKTARDEQPDGRVTNNRRTADDYLSTTTGNSHVPTVQEVIEYGKGGIAVSEELCRKFWNFYQGNQTWLNQHGRLIDWKTKLATWKITEQSSRPANGQRQPDARLKSALEISPLDSL